MALMLGALLLVIGGLLGNEGVHADIVDPFRGKPRAFVSTLDGSQGVPKTIDRLPRRGTLRARHVDDSP